MSKKQYLDSTINGHVDDFSSSWSMPAVVIGYSALKTTEIFGTVFIEISQSPIVTPISTEMKKKTIVAGLSLFMFLASVFTYYFYRYAVNIEGIVERNIEEISIDSVSVNKPAVYISVISRYPPHIIYSGYQPVLDYLTSKTAYRFELRLCDDYGQAVKMLIRKEVAAAFVGSYVYIKAHDEYGVIPILKPLNSNFEPFSRSVLFTTGSKNIFSLNDLRKKKIALPSKESYSSNWLLHYVFKKNNIMRSDLQEVINFPHHQSVILNVTKVLRANTSLKKL
ncbi:MAG: PhnD/SsuA/transferrin family substrate-binding protein [Ignavibacteriales bacterium]|nr:PhnD/SsuA/transferrin family substrate-binding protein [Ignavibacteriales bacterium]